jgi:hypothetical protein
MLALVLEVVAVGAMPAKYQQLQLLALVAVAV